MKTLPTGGVSNPYMALFYTSGAVTDGIAMVKNCIPEPIRTCSRLFPRAKRRRVLISSQTTEKKKTSSVTQAIVEGSAAALNSLIYKKDLSTQPMFADHKELVAEASAAEADSPELWSANRRLLDAVLKDAVRPLAVKMPTEAFIIDCQGDRTQPATFLKQDNWAEYLAQVGAEFAENTKKFGNKVETEFWNEPYLDW